MTDAQRSLFTDARLALRFLREVEDGLLAAMEWMPYASDVPEESWAALVAATEKHRCALDDVREARQNAEWAILDEAVR